MSRPDTYYFLTHDIWNDPNIKIRSPKYNDSFVLNVSGMTFKQLAECLRLVAECIDIAIAGYDVATADYEVPFLDARISSEDKFPWEDGYDDCNFCSDSLLEGVRTFADGSSEVSLSETIKQATDDGKTISEFMRRRIIVTNTPDGQKIDWEYADEISDLNDEEDEEV